MAKHSEFQNAKICLGEVSHFSLQKIVCSTTQANMFRRQFWLWGASDDEGADYLTQLLPWLDSNSNVACYQAFGGLWEGNFINSAGTGLSKSGQVYHDL